MVAQLHSSMLKMENFQKLHELKKDLIGIDNLVIPGRVSDKIMHIQGGYQENTFLGEELRFLFGNCENEII